jgi:hypothetical protein
MVRGLTKIAVFASSFYEHAPKKVLIFLFQNLVYEIPVKRLGKKEEVRLNCDESVEYDSGTVVTM